MVIAVLQHGLGNQLFQYAAGRAVAERSHTRLLLDVTRFGFIPNRTFDLAKLRIRASVLPRSVAIFLTPGSSANPVKARIKALAARSVRTLVDPGQGYDARVLDAGRFSRLDGYWQSERYFAHLRAQLTDELEPRQGLPATLETLSRRMAAEESVAVHVRRGDLVNSERYSQSVGVLGREYYEEALGRFKARFPEARVYLFSDDPAWCAENIPRVFPTEVVSGRHTRSAVEDLTLMKRCRHFVIANSTFSWWGAWLGSHPSKRVIAPARFFREPNPLERDLLPTGWETVDPSFEPVAAPAI